MKNEINITDIANLKLKHIMEVRILQNISRDEMITSDHHMKKRTEKVYNETNIKTNGNRNETHTHIEYIGCFIHNLNMRLHDNNNDKEQ